MNRLTYDRDDISGDDLEKLHYFIDRYTEGETVMLESGRFLDWINGNTQIMGNTDLYRAIASRPSKSLFKEFEDLTAFMEAHGFSDFPEKVDFSADIDMSAFEEQLSGIPDEPSVSPSDPESPDAEPSLDAAEHGPDAPNSTKASSGSPDVTRQSTAPSDSAKPRSKYSKPRPKSPGASKANSKSPEDKSPEDKSPEDKSPEDKSNHESPDAAKPSSESPYSTNSTKARPDRADSTRSRFGSTSPSGHSNQSSNHRHDNTDKYGGRTAADATINEKAKKAKVAEGQKRQVKFDPFLSPALIIGNGLKKLITAPFKSAAQSYNDERIRRESAQASILSRGSPELERFGINAKNKIKGLNNEIDSDINAILGNAGMSIGEKENVKNRIIKNATDLKLVQTQTIDNYLNNDHVGKAVKGEIVAEIKNINKSLQKLENSADADPEIKNLSKQINQILKGVMEAIAAIFNKKESAQENTL